MPIPATAYLTGGPHPAAAGAVLDPDRLRALAATHLAESSSGGDLSEDAFDRTTWVVRRALDVPVALLSLVDADRQVFKSQQGLAEPWASRRQTPLSHSFCQHVVATGEAFVVDNAEAHPLVCDNRAIADLDVAAYLGAPVRSPSGHVLGSLCAIDSKPRRWEDEDVEALEALAAAVETEIALRAEVTTLDERERQLRTVLANVHDIVFQTDAQGRYTYLNGAWAEQTGHAVEDSLGRHCLAFAAGDVEALGAWVAARTQGADRDAPEAFHIPVQARHADGSTIHLESSWRPAFDEDGTHLGWAGVYANVTDTVRYHAERQAREVAEVAQAEAERMARLKTAFLSNMSHEIRTPLTAIIGYADILVSEVPADLRDLADPIVTGGRRLLGTLNAVLDLAQIESGELKPRPRSTDVVALITGAVGDVRPQAEAKGLRLVVEAPDALSAVVDEGLLDRAVSNLVGNAVKFTEVGSVTVRAALSGPDLTVEVSDTGIGIAEGDLPYLFDAFQQASEGDARTHEGNGLGLSLVRQVCELMGGCTTVESEPGVGSRFTIKVPATAVAEA